MADLAPTLGERLERLRLSQPSWNRWKLLQSYDSARGARVAASRLRRRYRPPEWNFRTTAAMADGRFGLGVMYKHPASDGRAPESP